MVKFPTRDVEENEQPSRRSSVVGSFSGRYVREQVGEASILDGRTECLWALMRLVVRFGWPQGVMAGGEVGEENTRGRAVE